MAKSDAGTVAQYLEALAPERRREIAAVLRMVRAHLPPGYVERMAWGMISWEVPLETCPDTYNGKPLAYVCLAAQKNHNALYLMGCYIDSLQERRLREAYAKLGRRIDMGKSCLRFTAASELPMDVLGAIIAEMPPAKFVAHARAARAKALEAVR